MFFTHYQPSMDRSRECNNNANGCYIFDSFLRKFRLRRTHI
jgi:hypothetical protein